MATTPTKKTDTSFAKALGSGLLQAPLYPLNLVKVLTQINHEPLAPYRARTLFGKEQYYYPNALSYMKYIYSVEGVTGLYRGFGMKIISHGIGTAVYSRVCIMQEDRENDPEYNKETDPLKIFTRQTTKEVIARGAAVIVSHPFHVMTLRCIAQFVGGETYYSSWNPIQNILHVYDTEGISGLFTGLLPRLIFEVSTIVLANAIGYLIKTYIIDEKEIDALLDLFGSLLANMITYPLSLVSTVTCISGSSLIAGQPPKMHVYVNWTEAFKHLRDNNQLNRGSSSFFRVYNPNQQLLSPVNTVFQLRGKKDL